MSLNQAKYSISDAKKEKLGILQSFTLVTYLFDNHRGKLNIESIKGCYFIVFPNKSAQFECWDCLG